MTQLHRAGSLITQIHHILDTITTSHYRMKWDSRGSTILEG